MYSEEGVNVKKFTALLLKGMLHCAHRKGVPNERDVKTLGTLELIHPLSVNYLVFFLLEIVVVIEIVHYH